ncbi:alpha/beta fold hydrolase [Nocardia sp. 004]|uniref:alpha/beta fold hydrolase n=1 Tax=Nocardia sp. 004 TaxID=3385978 RepID=UPI0039A3A6A8
MPYIDIEGARVHYTDSGESSWPVMVFAHGFFMDSSMFAPQVEFVESRGVRALCLDARGHGDTMSDPDRPFTYWDSARDMLAVMDDAGVEHATLVGMSQGGYTTLRTALLDPSRVDALVLLDTEASASTAEEKAGYQELFDAWTDPNVPLATLADSLAPRLIGGTDADQAPWRAKWHSSDRPLIRPAANCLIERETLLDRLGEITCPAIVIRGEHDQTSTAEKSAVLAAGLPGANGVVTIPGAGHAANWTAPHLVNEVIGGFLKELSVGSPVR